MRYIVFRKLNIEGTWVGLNATVRKKIQMPLCENKFSANPKRFILRVASLYRNVTFLSKENQYMTYIIFRKLNIEGTSVMFKIF